MDSRLRLVIYFAGDVVGAARYTMRRQERVGSFSSHIVELRLVAYLQPKFQFEVEQ